MHAYILDEFNGSFIGVMMKSGMKLDGILRVETIEDVPKFSIIEEGGAGYVIDHKAVESVFTYIGTTAEEDSHYASIRDIKVGK